MKRLHHYVPIDDIVGRITYNPDVELPQIVLGIGPVRSGTTASLRVYGQSGVPAYSQPIKSIFRHLAKGKPLQECGWAIPAADCIYIKETLGLLNAEESFLNPLDVLFQVIQKGLGSRGTGKDVIHRSLDLLASKVHVVVLGRNPFDSWYSVDGTLRKLLENVSQEESWYYETTYVAALESHIYAYRSVDNLRSYAQHLGIPVSHYVAEANTVADVAYRRLFQRIGLEMEPCVHGWTERSLVGAPRSHVIVSSDHLAQQRAGLFEPVNQSSGVKYVPGSGGRLAAAIKNKIVDAGLMQIYERWLLNTKAELDIDFYVDMSVEP